MRGLLLTPLLSLAEDAELVQCKYLGGGLAGGMREGHRYWAQGPLAATVREWALGSGDLGGGLIPGCYLHAL